MDAGAERSPIVIAKAHSFQRWPEAISRRKAAVLRDPSQTGGRRISISP